jgi:hypothetical protein
MTLVGRTNRAKQFKKATQFFYENAGYSYKTGVETPEQGKKRCARSLARAERYAREHDFSFEWQYDDAGCSGCSCESDSCKCSTGESHETLGCIARDSEGKIFASFWGICEPSQDYRREIEAELATGYR